MNSTDFDALREEWLREEREPFTGWDFSHIEGRYLSEGLPWDYRGAVQVYLRDYHDLLDLGTGAGEFLLTLGHPPEKTGVTEGYAPNLLLCRERLEPLGVTVRAAGPAWDIPYGDESFDAVINRHGEYDPEEVYRVLRPRGLFITQQVGGQHHRDLSRHLIDDFVPPFPQLTLENCKREAEAAGFDIPAEGEHFPMERFLDVGALVYYVKAAIWEFPGFSVERCFEKLKLLQRVLEKEGHIPGRGHYFMLVCRKP